MRYLYLRCPICSSVQIETRHLARKIGGVIGTTAGSIGGAVSSLSDAEIGTAIDIVARPPDMTAGGFLGALLGAVVGGTAGCMAGTRLGELIDDRVLDNHRCQACGHCFSARDVPVVDSQ